MSFENEFERDDNKLAVFHQSTDVDIAESLGEKHNFVAPSLNDVKERFAEAFEGKQGFSLEEKGLNGRSYLLLTFPSSDQMQDFIQDAGLKSTTAHSHTPFSTKPNP